MYENKEKEGNLPDEMRDIFAQLKPILQKITGLEGQFAVNYAFRAQYSLFPAFRLSRLAGTCKWCSPSSAFHLLPSAFHRLDACSRHTLQGFRNAFG